MNGADLIKEVRRCLARGRISCMATSRTRTAVRLGGEGRRQECDYRVPACTRSVAVCSLSTLYPLAFHEHLYYLGAGELRRRILAPGEHLAHLGSGEEDVRVRVVGAGLGRTHAPALRAEERVLEEQGGDPEFLRLELLEDVLGVVGPVVAADAGVVAAHDKVRAAVVLAADGVEDGLPRARVAHGGREHREHGPVFRIVLFQYHLVRPHPDVGRYVV